MKSRHFLRLLVLVAIGLLLSGKLQAAETIVATVGSVPITQFEVDQKVQQLMPQMGGYHANVRAERVETVRDEALQTLIDRAYLVQYGLQQKVSVDSAAIEAELVKIRKNFKDDGELQTSLGISLAGLREMINRKLLAEKVEEMYLVEPSKVSDQELHQFYDKNHAKYLRPKRFRANAIYIKVDPTLSDEEQEGKRKLANELVARAREGEDFYDLAYHNSDHSTRYVGGDTGYFHQGQMKDAELEKIVLALKPGEISNPIQNVFGYHIIKLTEVENEKQLAYDEVKDNIKNTLEKERREQRTKKLMYELKSKYSVVKSFDIKSEH